MRVLLLLLWLSLPVCAQEVGLGWLVGRWDTHENFLTTGQTAEGTANFEMVLGDTYLFERYSANRPDGLYQGHGYNRWDREKNKLELWWFEASGLQQTQTQWDGKGPRVFLGGDAQAKDRETYIRTGPDEFRYLLERDEGKGFQPVLEVVARRHR